MPEFDPDNLIGRIFLLPPQENGERLRAKVTKKVVEEIEVSDGNRIPNIKYGNGMSKLNGKLVKILLNH